MTPPKGETITQSIKVLQEIMEADAITIYRQDKKIRALELKVESLQRRLMKRSK